MHLCTLSPVRRPRRSNGCKRRGSLAVTLRERDMVVNRHVSRATNSDGETQVLNVGENAVDEVAVAWGGMSSLVDLQAPVSAAQMPTTFYQRKATR